MSLRINVVESKTAESNYPWEQCRTIVDVAWDKMSWKYDFQNGIELAKSDFINLYIFKLCCLKQYVVIAYNIKP